MIKAKITNIHPDRVIERLGFYFAPKQSAEIYMDHSRHLTLLQACKFLNVEILKQYDVSNMTVEEVLQGVQEQKLTIEEAMQAEQRSKNRKTLLDKLTELKGKA
ncbi:hypothetical protein J2Z48_002656 [Croceifilum oryzae]|uniref:Uncharacterized protein n=1 Tax=Croceifilum oryzae TaxID=1553429 RepID=A0AAJ1THB6_9BACL|nr:hypothetical protein [Croceifilum oryzae]MDQ0418464.1 hypothetical protein [Croceifilum oryzae]